MLTNFLIYTLYLILKVILSPLTLLSDVVLPAGFTSALTTATGYISVTNQIFPTATLVIIIGLFLTLEGFVFGFKMINWIIKKIPFLG